MHKLARLDHAHVWHPFTQMQDWLKREPIVIREGRGALLRDVQGKEYLDANSSIWTNLHGHNHPVINRAVQSQLNKIAHSSALGLANAPASVLAERLVSAANSGNSKPNPVSRRLCKAFFSDDGSTAMEVALKLAFEYSRRKGVRRPKFLSLGGAYHGDTVGAVSLGHIDLFHKTYSGLLFKTDQVSSPYCYRCRFNRARPERGDAREYRRCNWECLDILEQKFQRQKQKGNPYSGFVFEPVIQGAAGMIAQPRGWLRRAAKIARSFDALLVADEVMTGFGRTGLPDEPEESRSPAVKAGTPPLFACQREKVQPDLLALAKGLTGGYLPMAATLTTRRVFEAFLGNYGDFKTFFHGHSYTANQLGASAAVASLQLLSRPESIRSRARLQRTLSEALRPLLQLASVGDIRQAGLVAGVELVRDWRTRKPFALEERAGIRVCEAMARQGVLTRPIGNVVVIMPPYCTTEEQVHRITRALAQSIRRELGDSAAGT